MTVKRGFGRVYQPSYRDKRTRERRVCATWWVELWVRGRRHRCNSHSTKRAVAVGLLNRLRGEASRGRVVTPDLERTTFDDLARMLLDDYAVNQHKSLETAQASLKALRATFGLYRAPAITLDELNHYVAARLAAGRKPATVRNELAALKRAFHLAERAGKAVCPPFPTLRVHNTRTGFFEESAFRTVLKHLPTELQPVAEFAYLTGWRKSEILGLTWAQVDFTAGTIRLEPGTTKNDEGRLFPFATFPALGALLSKQREQTRAIERATGRIIPWAFHRDGQAIRDFRGAWAEGSKLAGVPGRLFHDFRRTAVRNLERAGVPRSVAMKLTGHKTESIYRRYAIVAEADLLDGVRKLAALHHADNPRGRALPSRSAM